MMEAISWNGSGFPPVGSVVLTENQGRLFKVRILAYGKSDESDAVMCRNEEPGDDFWGLHAWIAKICVFRPIPTPEQIEAKNRELAVDEISMIMLQGGHHDFIAGRIYDAGYRKQEPKPE